MKQTVSDVEQIVTRHFTVHNRKKVECAHGPVGHTLLLHINVIYYVTIKVSRWFVDTMALALPATTIPFTCPSSLPLFPSFSTLRYHSNAIPTWGEQLLCRYYFLLLS